MNKLEQIRAVVNVWLREPSDDPVEGACAALSAITDILDDSDAIDAAHLVSDSVAHARRLR